MGKNTDASHRPMQSLTCPAPPWLLHKKTRQKWERDYFMLTVYSFDISTYSFTFYKISEVWNYKITNGSIITLITLNLERSQRLVEFLYKTAHHEHSLTGSTCIPGFHTCDLLNAFLYIFSQNMKDRLQRNVGMHWVMKNTNSTKHVQTQLTGSVCRHC